MKPMAQHPVVPKPWVVICHEGVNPAKLHLPRTFDIAGNDSAGSNVVFEDNIGSGGIIARYIKGPWQVELGWVDTFMTDDNPGLWNDWVLGHGLHTKLRFTF